MVTDRIIALQEYLTDVLCRFVFGVLGSRWVLFSIFNFNRMFMGEKHGSSYWFYILFRLDDALSCVLLGISVKKLCNAVLLE